MDSVKKIKYIMIMVTVIILAVTIKISFENERAQRLEESAAFLEEHTYYEDISVGRSENSDQNVKVFQAEDQSCYLFLPSGMDSALRVYFSQFKELEIDGKVYASGSRLPELSEDAYYIIKAKGWDDVTAKEAVLKIIFAQDIPTVYIKSQNGTLKAVDADRSVKETAQITFADEQGEKNTADKCTIKARGNTSYRDISQKSYNIKLDSSQSVFGLPAGTEWSLLANYREDLQQLKNKMAMDIAERIGIKYNPKSCFVNVYIDGQYNGLYLLTQRVSADGGSVGIYDLEAENKSAAERGTLPENMSGGYLLEFDIRAQQEEGWFPLNGQNVRVKAPEAVLEEELTYIMYYMKKVEYLLYSETGMNPDTGETYRDCMDLESWAKMYLMQEFFVQWDAEFSSFYMYKELDDPLIYAGPVWDFDVAYGSVWLGRYPKLTARTMLMRDKGGWLNQLDQYPEFHELVFEKYREEFAPVIGQYLEEEFPKLAKSLQSSMNMNAVRWGRTLTDVDQEAEEMASWIRSRKQFLDEYTADEDSFTRVNFNFSWGSLSYYAKTGEALNYLPEENYGQTDKRAAADYQYGNLIGWQEESGAVVTENTVIDEEKDFFAVYAEK